MLAEHEVALAIPEHDRRYEKAPSEPEPSTKQAHAGLADRKGRAADLHSNALVGNQRDSIRRRNDDGGPRARERHQTPYLVHPFAERKGRIVRPDIVS